MSEIQKAFGTFPTEHGHVVLDVFTITAVELKDKEQPRVAIVTAAGLPYRIYSAKMNQLGWNDATEEVMATIAAVASAASRPPAEPAGESDSEDNFGKSL